jgi:hypothetical protein
MVLLFRTAIAICPQCVGDGLFQNIATVFMAIKGNAPRSIDEWQWYVKLKKVLMHAPVNKSA